MTSPLGRLLAAAAIAIAAPASAQVTFYEHDNFDGRSFTVQDGVDNFSGSGFNDRASSAVVSGGAWEVCDDAGFRGRCRVLRPGRYRSLQAMDLNDRISSARAVDDRRDRDRRGDNRRGVPQLPPPRSLPGQITFFEHDDFQGRSVASDRDVPDFNQLHFSDRASSVVVLGERWEACDDIGYRGRCVVLRPGRYPTLGAMGLNDRLSSVRLIDGGRRFEDDRQAPPPPAAYDWRRRPQERLYQADVTSVRAIYDAPQQRCWIEREQVVSERRGDANVGGAVLGGVLGGILGHQIGGGSGRDLATIGGAVGGAVIGANVNRDGSVASTQNVQRCAPATARGRPAYWDVGYSFRGIQHHLQAPSPPGATVTVNEDGEPRL